MTARLVGRSAALFGVGAAAAASMSDGLCLFRACTGMACPGCGMTRAAGRLLSGDLPGSVAMHPLLLPTIVVGLVWVAEWAMARGRRPVHGPRLAIALAIAIPVVWLVRLVTGALPPV